jgi:hypothetical protein
MMQGFYEHLRNNKLRKKTPASVEILIAMFLELYIELYQFSLHFHKMNSLNFNLVLIPTYFQVL